jgi:hypothetical protein
MKVVRRYWPEDDYAYGEWLFQEPKGPTPDESSALWLLMVDETANGDYEAALMLKTFGPWASDLLRDQAN